MTCSAVHLPTKLRCKLDFGHGIPDDGYNRTDPIRSHLAEKPSAVEGYKDCFIWTDKDDVSSPLTAECPNCGTEVIYSVLV